MVFPQYRYPDVEYYKTVVHSYSTNRPGVIPLSTTAHHNLYTHHHYDSSSANLVTTYVFLVLFLALCYRLIDRMFFQGRLINTIFNFNLDGEEDMDSTIMADAEYLQENVNDHEETETCSSNCEQSNKVKKEKQESSSD
ncbi:hypothetical protein PGO_120380 [Plasmodium gonderi]|uniref:Uncharacterized protein n=1 Tax=Plasmodium gonderi TaxID=77519 RepID=A0A1Y1JHP5_PLAGO|nr:hypothetical protein PGO_120380 [Plasmodium gonderi]GAW82046.1 hypothetical protein PGO_120380 [Plasmodium gonderi]